MSHNPYESSKNQEANENQPANSSEVSGMKAHELFGVLVRTIGFCMFLVGVDYAWGIVVPAKGRTGEDYVQGAVAFISIGFFVFFGAGAVVGLAYGRNKP